MPSRRLRSPRGARRSRLREQGQSLAELALVLPVLLFLMLVALDFGRVYLGWINLQNMARIAANYAANNATAWTGAGDPVVQQRYQELVLNDARATNCQLPAPGTVPPPSFPDGTDLGDRTVVSVSCGFQILTPVIASVLGDEVTVAASSVFPVKSGGVTDIPSGGTSSNVPVAEFSGSPLAGQAALTVQFTDLSQNAPATWTWNFGDGGGSNAQSPTHTYAAPGTYTVSLIVTNAAGTDSEIKSDYIDVSPAPGTGPVPEFTADQTAGNAPLTVRFSDLSTGTPTVWAWDFDDDGTIDSTDQNPIYTYSTAGTYSVTLTVSNASGTNSQTKVDYITVSTALCVVPNVSDGTTRKNDATQLLQSRGFVVDAVGGPGNWRVRVQNPQGGLPVPCGSTVQIFE